VVIEPAPAYRARVSSERVPAGVVHKLPTDLRKALIANDTALVAPRSTKELRIMRASCFVCRHDNRMTPEHIVVIKENIGA
jgi:hypothetical protein